VAPHLALVDLRMPRMDGLDLLMALSGRPELTFPAVVLTSSAASHDAICSRMRGAIRVVTKPDTLAELTAVLSIAIDAVCPQGSELSTRRNAWALAVPRRQRLRGKQSPAAPPPEPKTKTKTNPPQ
jgi:DNA-binding response OmpR family regulator